MRPQQNRRMRGRSGGNNNSQNRKGPNPLTRNYESNGPDVKIRGSAQQIAEKYAALARDAQSSGDRVIAENYLQHAEHYNRIIMAAQAQMPQQQARDTRDEDDADEDGDENVTRSQHNEQPRQQSRSQEQGEKRSEDRNDGTGPQPDIEGFPAELTQPDVVANVAAEETAPAPAPKTRTPRKRATAKVETDKPVVEKPEASATEAAQQEEEAPRRAPRPRRPRLKIAEADGAEAAGKDAAASAPDEEIVTEAAQ